MNFCKKQKKVQRTESRVLINIELVKSPWHPFSPEGCTIITPGDRSPEGEGTGGRWPPKVSARRAPQPKRTHVKIVFMGLTDANQLLLQWRPPGAGLGGQSPPRVASHSVLLTRGYFSVALRAGKIAPKSVSNARSNCIKSETIPKKFQRDSVFSNHIIL